MALRYLHFPTRVLAILPTSREAQGKVVEWRISLEPTMIESLSLSTAQKDTGVARR